MLPIQIAHPGKDEKNNVHEYLKENFTEVKKCPEINGVSRLKPWKFFKKNSKFGRTHNCQMLDFFFSVSVGFSLEALKRGQDDIMSPIRQLWRHISRDWGCSVGETLRSYWRWRWSPCLCEALVFLRAEIPSNSWSNVWLQKVMDFSFKIR